MRPIVLLGAGSWGTALAVQFARAGRPTVLWGRAEDEPELLARVRRNERYLPGVEFPPLLTIEPDLARAIEAADDLVVAVPSGALRSMLTQVQPLLGPRARLAWASKGFEIATGKLPHQIALEVLGPNVPIAVLSGPTFAREVGAGLPTAIAVASPDPAFALELARSISSGRFHAYTQPDIVGVEVGGAVKNVLAIATGASDGMGYGSNSRVFLITRGLAEMVRLAVALGARQETMMGLAGLGDLVLTCTDDQSRNRRFGRAIAAGQPIEQAIREIGQAVEGYHAARAVHTVAQRLGVEMPICEHVYQVLYEGMPIPEVVTSLLTREVTPEN
ncbi:MAG: NAD(P)-dependent glycerol-3-phosphate dehydrogenase [Gammaproteobacteria bacterium]|nr:MAG: NAD(P)-dependent glycerol-3-phosphate dehydrogenase [Gammaproteobacteria bacterium]